MSKSSFNILISLILLNLIIAQEYPSQKFLQQYQLLQEKFQHSSQSEYKVNNYPVIGIYALPSQFPQLYNAANYTFIGASYVNWIHAAGARVIPISSHSDQATLKYLFNQVNGILFTGGASDLVKDGQWTQYAQNVMYLISLTKEANDKGDYFPLWGTCMGFEALAVAISGNKTLLTKVQDINRHGNITFVNRSSSTIFQNLSDSLANYMQTGAPNLFDHHDGLTLESFQNQPSLNQVLKLTSTAITEPTKIEIVSSFEHKQYPIFAVQFHPEKNQYIWLKPVNVSHTYEAMLVGQYMANAFVQTCRKNFHSFTTKQELNKLIIYNYQWIHVPSYYMGGFFFNNSIAEINFFEN